ncbi:MAG: hypothetical protein K2Y28_05945 [Burkholderiaceae bacterium]|nr:hypothetical protein [Burkholderiaceae bacterium]
MILEEKIEVKRASINHLNKRYKKMSTLTDLEIEAKIENAKQKLEQLQAFKKKREMQKKALDSKKKRADETRKKILVGASIFIKIERGDFSESWLLEILNSTLTREVDRSFFNLNSLSNQSNSEETQQKINL